MLKISTILSLVLIVSGVWSGSITCDSCGSECAAACGTRHFRACCFNYLRKKRTDGVDPSKLWRRENSNTREKYEDHKFKKNPFLPEDPVDAVFFKPVYMAKDFEPYSFDDVFQNRLQSIYDA